MYIVTFSEIIGMFNIWNNWLLDNNLFYYYNFIQRAGRYTARFIFNNSRIKILVLRKRLFKISQFLFFFIFLCVFKFTSRSDHVLCKSFLHAILYYIILLRKELK